MRFPWSKSVDPEKDTTPSQDSSVEATDEATHPEDSSSPILDEKNTGKEVVNPPVNEDETVSETQDDKGHVIERTESTATASTNGEEDISKYKTGLPLYLLTFGLALSTFVVALDNTIIATAIPRITTVFDSLNDVGWYGSSYLLTTTSLQPSFGKIYTYFNVKWTYLGALFIFEIGSVICGVSVNSEMLIVGRAVAGCGAAALFSGGMTIVAYSVPLHRRPIYIGLLSSMFGIASVVGPILGGALTDRVSWRWCFYINLPVGAIAMTAVFFFFQNPERKESELTFVEKIKQIDLLGAGFLISAIVCLLLALQVSFLSTILSFSRLIHHSSGAASSIHGTTPKSGAASSASPF